jgi:hypothetical protein
MKSAELSNDDLIKDCRQNNRKNQEMLKIKNKTMKLHRIKLAGITLILLIAGCIEQEKDDLTLPVRVHFRIGLKADHDESAIIIGISNIGIQDIQFEGIREAGGNVYFETDPKMDLSFNGYTLKNLPIFDYDIPQGIYNYMRWDIALKRIVTPAELEDDADSLSLGLVLYGSYELMDDPWYIPVIFAIDDTEEFIVRFADRIALSSNKDYKVTMFLHRNAFRLLNYEDAEITGEGDFQRIIITSTKNKDIYEKILYQLNRSASVDIEEIDPSTL